MDLLNLGIQSRKTGIKPKQNLRRDEYDMEDIDDFFEEESDNDDTNLDQTNSRTGDKSGPRPRELVARKIDFNEEETNQFDLSPISINKQTPSLFVPSDSEDKRADERANEAGNDNNDYDNDDGGRFDDNNNFDDYQQYERSPSPDPSQSIPSPSNKTISSLTKNMALGKTKSKPRPKSRSQPNMRSSISKPSPLPSPPPDGLRRSRRTKITPLAYWRGERIIYTRANEEVDPDTTLGGDIHKIPLQEIKEVVHVSAPSPIAVSKRRKRNNGGNGTRTFKRTNDNNNKNDISYDYESDPEVIGSEWYKDKKLELRVFDGPDSENTKTELVAHTIDFDDLHEPNGDGMDNYKIGSLFKGSNLDNGEDDTTNILASAIFEFPVEGFKSVRRSDHCTYLFHVMKGLVEIQLSNSKFAVTRGCTFKIPSFNSYGITNIGTGIARLFCVQVLTDPPEQS